MVVENKDVIRRYGIDASVLVQLLTGDSQTVFLSRETASRLDR